MAHTAEDFLTSWTAAYVKADPRDLDELDQTVALCFEDADRLGLTKEAATEVAGGDLGIHLARSLT
jgi:hypothetical protein